MKLSILRSIAALAVVLGVAGCGSKAKFDVQGTIVGLEHSGLQLLNNGETLNVPAGATSFKFTKQIEYGEIYNVTIGKNPDHQNCGVGGGSDAAGRLISISVFVECKLNERPVTVTLNKAAPGLVLTNGSTSSFALSDTATVAQFSVKYGQSYGISVLTQPKAGGVCTVQNGSGIMGDDEIKNVTVTCP